MKKIFELLTVLTILFLASCANSGYKKGETYRVTKGTFVGYTQENSKQIFQFLANDESEYVLKMFNLRQATMLREGDIIRIIDDHAGYIEFEINGKTYWSYEKLLVTEPTDK